MEGRRRLMGLPPRVNGIFDAFKKVWATGGVRGLWKGNNSNLAKITIKNIQTFQAQFPTYKEQR